MTNPLIPYTFVPGSKAKAGEVNANFISLAEEIQNTQINCNNQFIEVGQTISDDINEVYTKCADKNLINSNAYTNAIISAPNGVLSASGTILTIKSGLQVLMTNGKNEDKSNKNISYLLEEDKSTNLSAYADGKRMVYLSSSGSIFAPLVKSCYTQESTPTQFVNTGGLWYNPATNISKKYNTNTNSWDIVNVVHLGYITISSGAITQVKSNDCVNFVKHTDCDYIATLAFPSKNVTSLTVGANGATYTMPSNGYLYYKVSANANNATVEITNNTRYYSIAEHKNSGFSMSGNTPVCKGDVMKIDYKNVSWGFLKFVYAQCEEV